MIRVLSVAVMVTGLVAYSGTINFDSDTVGSKANGFQSVDSPVVTFADSNGSGLDVGPFGGGQCGASQCLANFGDDPGYLLMTFSTRQNSLSLVFGNDDPCCTSAGDRAALTLFLGASHVGQVFVTTNNNDLADQTISYSGASFDSAQFIYTNATDLSGIDVTELVDNIQFSASAVPEPATVGLSGLGILALGLIRRFAKSPAAR